LKTTSKHFTILPAKNTKMRLLCICLFLLFGFLVKSQDRMISLAGDTINCKILDVNEILITYKFPTDDSMYTRSAIFIHQIIFSDGRIQNISERVIIADESEWQKVSITYDETDIEGLLEVGNIKTSASSNLYGDDGVENAQMEALKNLRKKAAKMGAFIVLVIGQSSQKARVNSHMSYWANAGYKAIAFTYKK
jgi:hypothetical protein